MKVETICWGHQCKSGSVASSLKKDIDAFLHILIFNKNQIKSKLESYWMIYESGNHNSDGHQCKSGTARVKPEKDIKNQQKKGKKWEILFGSTI